MAKMKHKDKQKLNIAKLEGEVSRLQAERDRLVAEALDFDISSGAAIPTEDECNHLVMGAPTDGGNYEVPETLARRYPAVHMLLTEAMT